MKKGPIILISLLALGLVFIGGVQYGKRVETANETISFILSVTPKPTDSPKPTQPLEYTSYEDTNCGISFLYPSILQITKESSEGAQLTGIETEDAIRINCDTDSSWEAPEKSASESALIQKIPVTLYKTTTSTSFQIKHPTTQSEIDVTISNWLFPLFQETFEFIN